MFDLIIIGGGPAGITAGIYASRQKLKTLLITKDFGGQIGRKTIPVENWPGNITISGKDLIKNFEKHLKASDVEIQRDEVSTIKKKNDIFEVKTEEKKLFKSKTVIVATGADPRPLEIPGEKEFIGRGVSYCVLCDGSLYSRDKTVIVIGGGNSAMEAVLFLANYAKKIYVLEYQKEIPAFEDLQSKCLATKKVKFITNVNAKEIKGDKMVNEIIYQDRETKKEKNLKIDAVFIEIGNSPATAFVKELVDFSKHDEIIVDCKICSTKTAGLFAAGDVTDVFPKQIVVAAAEGAKASISAYKYLKV